MLDFIDQLGDKYYLQFAAMALVDIIAIVIFIPFGGKWYEINPNKSIHSHKLFWLAILVPFYAAVSIAFPLFLEYDLQLDSRSYDNFFNMSKVPLGVLAFIVPLSLIIIRMHSSKQTAKQLENQDRQLDNQSSQLTFQMDQFENQKANDSFKHYLEHRSYIIGKLDNYLKDENCLVTFDSSDLYHKIFPDLGLRNFEFSKVENSSKFLSEFRKEVNSVTHSFLQRSQRKEREFSEWSQTYNEQEEIIKEKERMLIQYIAKINRAFRARGISIKSNISISEHKQNKGIPVMIGDGEILDSAHRNAKAFIDYITKMIGLSSNINEHEKQREETIQELFLQWLAFDNTFERLKHTEVKNNPEEE